MKSYEIFEKKNWNFKKCLKFWYFFLILNFKLFFFNFIILNFFLILKFSNILISKKQFLCNKKPYCTLVPRNFIHWFCTRVQYDFLLHRNCFLLINVRKWNATCSFWPTEKQSNRALCNNNNYDHVHPQYSIAEVLQLSKEKKTFEITYAKCVKVFYSFKVSKILTSVTVSDQNFSHT
jgi:hypothetical protein